jgi:hypothetical protein
VSSSPARRACLIERVQEQLSFENAEKTAVIPVLVAAGDRQDTRPKNERHRMRD